jgi:uncharacterized protein
MPRAKRSGRPTAGLRPSRFNAHVREHDGTLLVFNSLTSAFLQFTSATADTVADVLGGATQPRGDLAELLIDQGVVVAEEVDEFARATALHERPFTDDGVLGLMLLANENCNFRCVYCYEEFKKNGMLPEVVEGVLALVAKRIDRLRRVSLGWFGGEPLLSFDVIEEVCGRLRDLCAGHGVAFASQMTTNGYFLDQRRAARCIALGVTRFQVTLDGPAETHNRTRILAGGGPTFDRILSNLRYLRDHAGGFHVAIRVNFSPENLGRMPGFIAFLGDEFGRDPRFSVVFRPVGKWGSANDDALVVCSHHDCEESELELTALAQEAGFSLAPWKSALEPFGSYCYAASPRHFVIGSDGIVYKCTVAFNDPRNHVGRLDRDGDLNLREDLVQLWTRSGEETDVGCRACGFRPACQGNLCPLERIEGREKRCPTPKTHLQRILPLLARDARLSLPVVT